MKTVDVTEVGGIICPVCKKLLVALDNYSDKAKYCKHVAAWYNSVVGWVKRTREFHNGLRHIHDDAGASDVKLAVNKFCRGRKDLTVVLFDSGYLGGCKYGTDIVVFKKEVK